MVITYSGTMNGNLVPLLRFIEQVMTFGGLENAPNWNALLIDFHPESFIMGLCVGVVLVVICFLEDIL